MIDKSQIEVGIPKIASANELRGYGNFEGVFSDLFFISDLNKNFKYDPTDTTSVDDGDTVIVNVITGRRYKHIYDPEIDKKASNRIPFIDLSTLLTDKSNFTQLYLTDYSKYGHFYRLPSSSSEVVDDAIVIKDGNGNKFKRQELDWVCPEWFGARGDGLADDTESFNKAINYICSKGGTLDLRGKSYKVNNTVAYRPEVDSSVKFVEIKNGVLYTEKGKHVVYITGHNEASLHVSNVRFLSNRGQVVDTYTKIPNNIYVTDNARCYQYTTGIIIDSFNKAIFAECEFKDIFGVGILILDNKYTFVDKCIFDNMGKQAIESPRVANYFLSVKDSVFVDVGILPERFNVDGTAYYFEGDSSGKVWYTDNGDAIYHVGDQCIVSGNEFRNINRIGVCVDANANPTAMVETHVFDNIFIHDHPRLRCSNPQASIWTENGWKGIFERNTIRYIERNNSDLGGYAIVVAISHRIDTLFSICDNKISAIDYNKTGINGIKYQNVNGNIQIKNNHIEGSFYSCIYHTNITNGEYDMTLDNIDIVGNIAINHNTASSSGAFNYDNTSTDGHHFKVLNISGNSFKQANTARPMICAYASQKNIITDNRLNGGTIDLPHAEYSQGNFILKNNQDVGGLVPKNGTINTVTYLNIQSNTFTGDLNLGATVGTVRVSGKVLDNTIVGRLFIRSFNRLNISDNTIGEGILFNNNSQTSSHCIINGNTITTNSANKTGIYLNNTNQFTYQNIIVTSNNIIARAGDTDTIGIAFALSTARIGFIIDNNNYVNITTPMVNTGLLLPVRLSITINLPSIAAGTSYTSTITITGAKVGHVVNIAPQATLGGLSPMIGYVSAPDTVTYTISNHTSAAIDLATTSFLFVLS